LPAAGLIPVGQDLAIPLSTVSPAVIPRRRLPGGVVGPGRAGARSEPKGASEVQSVGKVGDSHFVIEPTRLRVVPGLARGETAGRRSHPRGGPPRESSVRRDPLTAPARIPRIIIITKPEVAYKALVLTP